VEATLPIEPQIIENAFLLVQAYRDKGKDVSATDFLLGATLMKYKHSNMFLFTKDHSDFINTLFDRTFYFITEHEYSVQVYAFYKFSEIKYSKVMNNLLKIEERKK